MSIEGEPGGMALLSQPFLELPCEFLVVLHNENPHLRFCSISPLSEELVNRNILLTESSDSYRKVERKGNWMRLFVLVIAALEIGVGKPNVIGFDRATPGKLPLGWTVAMTHAGAVPRWESIHDESAPSPPNVLAQLSQDKTAGRFPLAIWDGISLQDGVVSVAFKAVEGSIDRAAGIVWRYQDPGNYYIVRANALENNVVLYKVENGARTSIAPQGLPSRSYGVKHQIPSGRWNNLEIHFNGSRFTVFLNQERLFEAQDTTFQGPGKVGLWTKADSVTYFDDFAISEQRRPLK